MEFRTLNLSAHCNIDLVFKNGDQTINIQELRDAYDFITIEYHGRYDTTINMYMKNIGYVKCGLFYPIDLYLYANNKFKKDIFLYLPWPMENPCYKYSNAFSIVTSVSKFSQLQLINDICPCFIFTYKIDKIEKLGYKITKVGDLGLIYYIERVGKLTKAAIKN